MQIPPFVSPCKYGFWSHERTHSIERVICASFNGALFEDSGIILLLFVQSCLLITGMKTSICLTPTQGSVFYYEEAVKYFVYCSYIKPNSAGRLILQVK